MRSPFVLRLERSLFHHGAKVPQSRMLVKKNTGKSRQLGRSCRNGSRIRGTASSFPRALKIVLGGQEPMTKKGVAGLLDGKEEGERGRTLGQNRRRIGGSEVGDVRGIERGG